MMKSKKLFVYGLAILLAAAAVSCNYKTCPTYSKQTGKAALQADKKA